MPCLNLIVEDDRNCQNCLTLKSFVSVNHINTLGDLFDCKLIQTSRVKNAIIFSPIILRGYYGPSILPHRSPLTKSPLKCSKHCLTVNGIIWLMQCFPKSGQRTFYGTWEFEIWSAWNKILTYFQLFTQNLSYYSKR